MYTYRCGITPTVDYGEWDKLQLSHIFAVSMRPETAEGDSSIVGDVSRAERSRQRESRTCNLL